MTADRLEPAAEPRLRKFYQAYSEYVDGFLERRSVLSASLFPEKPNQMAFGYDWVASALPAIVDALSEELPPAELATRFRSPGSRCTPLTVTGTLWMYLFGLLGRHLRGEQVQASKTRRSLTYWHELYMAYTKDNDPSGWPPGKGSAYRQFHVYDQDAVRRLEDGMRPAHGPAIQTVLARLANYAWLLECESRQATSGHGLYPLGVGESLLVREFVDLRGRFYPWMDDIGGGLPADPVIIGLRVRDLDATTDAFGVPSVHPDKYGDHITGLVVHCGTQAIDDPGAFLSDLAEQVAQVQRHLFRAVMGWGRPDRFKHGATTYARILADVLAVAGHDEAAVAELTFDHLDHFSDERLTAYTGSEEPAAIWPWAARRERPTVFEPVLALCL